MQEKDMVNDVIASINSSLTVYTNAIAHSSNQQLRQVLQQTRDGDEQFLFQLSQVAEQKGYQQPPQQVSPQEVQQLRSSLSQGQ